MTCLLHLPLNQKLQRYSASFKKDEDVVDYQLVMFHCLSLSILFLSTDIFQHVVGKAILTAAVAVTDVQESLCQHHVLVSSMRPTPTSDYSPVCAWHSPVNADSAEVQNAGRAHHDIHRDEDIATDAAESPDAPGHLQQQSKLSASLCTES